MFPSIIGAFPGGEVSVFAAWELALAFAVRIGLLQVE